jgi:hypothetical protein
MRTLALVTFLAMLAPARAFASEADVAPRPIPPPIETPTGESEAETETLLDGSRAYGGYAAPELKLTSIAQSPALLAGLEGGWVVSHRFVLSGAAYGLVSDVTSPNELQPLGQRAHLTFFYGGLRPAIVLAPRRVAHITVGVLVGGGAVGSETSSGLSHSSSSFFVFEPDIALELNAARAVRVGLGVGYRLCTDSDLAGLHWGTLSSPTATLALRFGAF